MPKYLLGIDNGSTVTKAGLFDLAGRECAVHGITVEAATPAPGRFERDLTAIWNANVEAISRVIRDSGAAPADILCCAITGHGNGLHLVDAAGEPAYPAITAASSDPISIPSSSAFVATTPRTRPSRSPRFLSQATAWWTHSWSFWFTPPRPTTPRSTVH